MNLDIYLCADLLFGSTSLRSYFFCNRVHSAPFRLLNDHQLSSKGHNSSSVAPCSLVRPNTLECLHGHDLTPSPHLYHSLFLSQPVHVSEANGPQATNTSALNFARKRSSNESCADTHPASHALLSSPPIGGNTSPTELATSMIELWLGRPQLQ